MNIDAGSWMHFSLAEWGPPCEYLHEQYLQYKLYAHKPAQSIGDCTT